jgi:hypothetical protein
VGTPGTIAQDTVEADHAEGRRRGVEGSPELLVDDHGYFCPSLRIEHGDDGLEISLDRDRFEALLARCFGL